MIRKKQCKVLTLICLVTVLALGSPLAALEQSVPEDAVETLINPSPMFVYINRISTSLSISSSGVATVTGSLTGYQGVTDEVWIFLYLERLVNGTWQTYDSWSQTFYTYRGVLQDTCSVAHGYYYRVRGSYYAWSGSEYEHTINYSGYQFY